MEERLENLADLNDFKTGCEAKLLANGRDAFLHRIQMIRSAKKSIVLQTFIWTDDECGRIVIHELLQAATRGVKVRIICDPVVSSNNLFSNQDPTSLAVLAHTKNLEVKIYNPPANRIKPSTLNLMASGIVRFQKFNQRMHNKMLMTDTAHAVCGGRNIENTYYDNSLDMNFRDLDVAIRGPVTKAMQKSFEQFWESPLCISLAAFKDVGEKPRAHVALNFKLKENSLYKSLPSLLSNYNGDSGFIKVEKAAFFSDAPGKNASKGFRGSSHLNNIIVNALKNAKERIWIQSPYVVMSTRAQKHLTSIRSRNEDLDITISTNSLAATDSWQAYAFLYKQKKVLVGDLNVKLYEFNPLPHDLLTRIPNYSDLLQQRSGLKFLTEEQHKKGDVKLYPRLCIHSKCMLTDDNFSFIGSYNMDPRSANLNTELSVVIIDKNFNRLLANHIAKDIAPRNSWAVGKRKDSIAIEKIHQMVAAINSVGVKITGLDLWPRRYSSCFQLKDGGKEVSCHHKDFHDNYHPVGNFPRVPTLAKKEVLARLFKAFGKSLKPVI